MSKRSEEELEAVRVIGELQRTYTFLSNEASRIRKAYNRAEVKRKDMWRRCVDATLASRDAKERLRKRRLSLQQELRRSGKEENNA